MSTRFIVPNGIGDGSSLAAAAPITDLNNQQNQAVLGAGEAEVWVISDLGPYDIAMSQPGVDSSANQWVFATINTQASSSSKKVKVCGRRRDGTPDHTVIQSQRIRPYSSYNNDHRKWEGQAGISCWVSYIDFEFMLFRDMGFGCIQVSASSSAPARRTAVNFDNIVFDNVRRGIWIKETSGLVGTEDAPCRMTNLVGRGTSKSFIRMDGVSQHVLIEEFDLDGDRQSGDNFAEGIHSNSPAGWTAGTTYPANEIVSYGGQTYRSLVAGNVGNTPSSSPASWVLLYAGIGGNTDITIRRGVVRNYFEYVFNSSGVYDNSTYWNADGITTERNCKRVTIEDVDVYDCTDGGFDLKSQETVLRRTHAEGSKRNYRLWSDVLLEDCTSDAPHKRGGSGSTAHYWFGDGGARLVRCKADSKGKSGTIFENEGAVAVSILGTTSIKALSGTTVYGGSGPYRTDGGVKVETSPGAPKLALADFLSITPTVVFGLRRLRGAYAGPLIKVRRVSDNALSDIYAGADGWLDEAAVAAHCGASVGTIDTWYSQDDVGRHLVQSTTSRQYRIYDGSAVTKKNARPAALVTVEDSGYFVGFPTYTGTQVTGVLVASLTSTAVSGETAAARFLSLLDTTANNDISSAARAILIGRRGGSVPTTNWGTRRSSTWYAETPSAGADTLDQIVTIYNGSQAQLYRRNGSPVTATSGVAFNTSRLGLGFAGNSIYASCPGACISEGWFFRDDIDATDRDELYSDQSVAFGLS